MKTVLHTEASNGWGGQEIRIIQESIGMISRGYRVLITASDESCIYQRAKAANIEAFCFSFNKYSPVSIAKIANLIDSTKIDILNTHSSSDSWVATIGAKLSNRKPVIIRTRHLSTPISKTFLSRVIYNILPDAVITTGEAIKQRMITDNGYNRNKICSIPTGINLNNFTPEQTIPAVEKKQFNVGMVSVLRSWKGHEYFIKAIPSILKVVPETQFYIVGNGPREGYIKSLISEMGLKAKVIMLGHREDIAEVMASMDVIVHPSYANEGVPQSLIQALAMRKAAVASDTGARKELIINGKTGFLVKKEDPFLIAEKVIHLYNNPELRKKFGSAGRSLIQQKYSITQMLDSIEELYEKLLNDKHNNTFSTASRVI